MSPALLPVSDDLLLLPELWAGEVSLDFRQGKMLLKLVPLATK